MEELEKITFEELKKKMYICCCLSERYRIDFIQFKKFGRFYAPEYYKGVNSWWYVGLSQIQGNYEYLIQEKIKFIKEIINNQKMEDLKEQVIRMANLLIEENGKTTTLEIKENLIQWLPKYYWRQSFISKTMIENEEKYNVEDNGTYRTYSIDSKIVPSTLSELAKIVSSNRGKFMTIVHKKQNGDINLMNCQILHQNDLGAWQVKEQKKYKQFYPKDLLEVRVKGKIYRKK